MAGRGLRANRDGLMRRPGEVTATQLDPSSVNIKHLIEKIDQICATNIDPSLLKDTESLFKQLFTNRESMKDVMMNLHCKALSDSNFGEKYVIALGHISNFAVDNIPVRSELLTFIENDFKIKETMFHSDNNKFLNSVMLLGSVYNVFKIKGVPLKVLGGPLLEYMDLLIQGQEEHHRILATQILLNGEKILMSDSLYRRYELLKHSLRKSMIDGNLSRRSRCWILLALDYMSNDLRPLNGVLRDFYLENLGEEYMKLEALLKQSKPLNWANLSMKCGKSAENSGEGSGDIFKDIENLSIPVEIKRTAAANAPKTFKHINNDLGLKKFSKDKGQELMFGQNQRLNVDISGMANSGVSKNENNRGGSDSTNNEDDDFYGIQISKEKISNIARKN